MKMIQCLVGMLCALTIFAASAEALVVSSGSTIPVSNPRNLKLTYERIWEISGTDSTSVLESLKLKSLGRVFISSGKVDDTKLGYVRVSGSSQTIVDHFEVLSESSWQGVQVRRKEKKLSETGYIFVDIVLASSGSLESIESVGSQDVVVNSALLLNDPKRKESVDLEVKGSGELFVIPQNGQNNMTMYGMDVSVKGSGGVYVSGNSMKLTEEMEVEVDGSGDVKIVMEKLTSKSVDASLDGSGDVCFNVKGFEADELKLSVEGSGDLALGTKGTCTSQTAKLEGSGKIYAGSVVCSAVSANLDGSGKIYVQAKDSLEVKQEGSGTIYYVEDRPKKVDGDEEDLKSASATKSRACTVPTIPPREPIQIQIGTSGAAASCVVSSTFLFTMVGVWILN